MIVPHAPPGFIVVAAAASTSPVDPTTLNSIWERLGLFGGFLILGWFFWRRDAARLDKRNQELEEELKETREKYVKLLEKLGESHETD